MGLNPPSSPALAQDFVLTDGQRDILSDGDVQQLVPGAKLLLVPTQGRSAVFKARR